MKIIQNFVMIIANYLTRNKKRLRSIFFVSIGLSIFAFFIDHFFGLRVLGKIESTKPLSWGESIEMIPKYLLGIIIIGLIFYFVFTTEDKPQD